MADEPSGEPEAVGATGLADVIPDADADVLVAEAVRRRDEQQSGRPMGRQLWRVAGCGAAGLLLVAGSRLLERGGHVGWVVADSVLVVGVIVIALAGLLLLRALDLSPATQWGEPVGGPCPSCGQGSLREDRVSVPGADAIVALCTPECGYAEVRPDPERQASSPQGQR